MVSRRGVAPEPSVRVEMPSVGYGSLDPLKPLPRAELKVTNPVAITYLWEPYHDVPTTPIVAVFFDSSSVTIVQTDRIIEYNAPEDGETLVLEAEPGSGFESVIYGEPVEPVCVFMQTERSWFGKWKQRILFLIIGGVALWLTYVVMTFIKAAKEKREDQELKDLIKLSIMSNLGGK